MGHLYHISLPGLRIIAEDGSERFQEPETVDEYSDAVFSGHNRKVTHRSSQWL